MSKEDFQETFINLKLEIFHVEIVSSYSGDLEEGAARSWIKCDELRGDYIKSDLLCFCRHSWNLSNVNKCNNFFHYSLCGFVRFSIVSRSA